MASGTDGDGPRPTPPRRPSPARRADAVRAPRWNGRPGDDHRRRWSGDPSPRRGSGRAGGRIGAGISLRGLQRQPILLDGAPVGWVEGDRAAVAVAAVLAYAIARETDKRHLAEEALDRYRELSLIYELAETIGATLEVAAVARVAVGQADRLPPGGRGFLFLRDETGALVQVAGDRPMAADGVLGAVLAGEAEIVNDVVNDPRTNAADRGIASLVAAPLKVRGERIGVIGAASTTPVEYRAGDLKVIAAIAAITAPTLDQAAVHEAALRAASRD